MDQIPLPSSLPEVEHLVHRLYEPNPPSTISQIQEVLQRLQKSPEGWQIAESLLNRPGDNVKFFGALTFIVKMNTETIGDDDARSVLKSLISWLLKSLENGSGPIVVRKLCSALVTHFIRFSHLWPLCTRDLLYCMHLDSSEALDDVKNDPPPYHMFQELTPQKSVAAIWFSTSLAEEGEKIDQKMTKYIGLHRRLQSNSKDVASLLGHSLSNPSGAPGQKDAISCLQAWIMYGQKVPNEQSTANLRHLLQPVIKCLAVDGLYDVAIELLIDILSNCQSVFTAGNYDLLYTLFESEWSRERYQNLLRGDFDFDSTQFGALMAAFGDAQITVLADGSNERAQRFLAALVGLLTAQGYPVAEDKIFAPALDFWSQFIENVVDTMCSEAQISANWSKPPLSYIMQVVSHCWRKIQFPSLSVFSSWDSTERVGFGDVRKDVTDLLQSVYLICGKPLISMFVDLTLQGLTNTSWAELEASAFCLGSLSDCVSDHEDYDDILSKVFGSSLFDLLRQGHSVVPVRARQTCLSLIERYSEYFTRHAENLPAALNLLFSAVNDRPLAGPSSKSIYRLCSSCRSFLTSEVDAFLDQYASLRSGPDLDSLAEERVTGAIGAIIQAIKDESQRINAFRRLLLLLGADIETCFQLKSHDTALDPNDPVVLRGYDVSQRPTVPISSLEVSLQVAIRVLRCLLAMAKGLQAPSETVDLDAEESGVAVYRHPDLEQTQRDLMSILLRMKETFGDSSEVLAVICSIIRAGFSETEPGPFVFPPPMVTEFLTSTWPNPVASAVSTASAFVSSLYNGNNKSYIPQALGILLPWVIDLLYTIQEPENDPELSQYSIELAQKAMMKQPEVFLQLQPTTSLEYLFMFAIKILSGNEPLPKFAAAEFWTNFLSLKSADSVTQAAISNAVGYLGPVLSHSLVQNIGGKAARSELEKLSEPLKKLVVGHVHARQWLEAALNDVSFPSNKVSHDDKALFLKKLISLRGAKATNLVVKEFWLACRGLDFAYIS